MIRFVAVAFLVFLAWLVLTRLLRMLQAARIDWNGVALAVGFVALAFCLRHVTGMG